MPNTNVVFNADTGKWRASLEGAEKSVLKTGDAVERVKGRILRSYQEQVAAAREAGKSQEELDRLQQRSAEKLSSVTEQNAQRMEKALDRLLEKQRRVANELNNMGQVAAKDAHGVPARSAISGAVRMGEGQNSIRAVESFIMMSPVAAKAVQALFPLVGGLGLAGMFVEMGESAYQAFKKIKEGADNIRAGWDTVNQPIFLAVDTLHKANAELDITIAHLEHKPANTLALALADTRIEVDKLAEAAEKANTDVKKLLEENRAGFAQWALNDQIGTGPAEDEIKKRMKDRQALALDLQSGLRGGKLTPGQVDEKRKALETMDRNNAQWATDLRTWLQSRNRTGNFDSAINDVAGFEQFSGNMFDLSDSSRQNTAKRKVVQDLEDRKKLAEAAKTAAAKANETQRKGWENEDDAFTNAGAGDPHILEVIWAERIRTLKAGSEQYIYAYHEFTEQHKKAAEDDARVAKEGVEKAARAQRTAWDVMHDNFALTARRSAQDEADFWSIRVLEAEQGSENYKEAMNRFTQAQAKADKEAADAKIRKDQAAFSAVQRRGAYDSAALDVGRRQGTISPHDFAVQQANIHAQVYAAEQEALQKRLADAQETGTPAETDAATEAIARSKAQRATQILQDAAETVGTTWQGALRDSLSNWVQDARDSAKQVEQLTQQAIDGLNVNLVNAMFGDKTDWAGMFKGLGKTVASDELKRVEASALGAFGIGKPDGSKQNPLYVIAADGAAGALGGGTGWLANLFGGASKSSGDDSSGDGSSGGGGGFFGGLIGAIGSLFGGGKAVGGDVQPGVAYDVGEAGRERFVPSVPGKIVPHKANDGAVVYQVNVANGVTPEQMKMHVREALREFHPQVVGASVAAVREFSARNPSTKR